MNVPKKTKTKKKKEGARECAETKSGSGAASEEKELLLLLCFFASETQGASKSLPEFLTSCLNVGGGDDVVYLGSYRFDSIRWGETRLNSEIEKKRKGNKVTAGIGVTGSYKQL